MHIVTVLFFLRFAHRSSSLATLAERKTHKGLRSVTNTDTSKSDIPSTPNSPNRDLANTPVTSVSTSSEILPLPTNPRTNSPTSSDEDAMTTRLNESGNIELSSGKYGPCVKSAAVLSPEDLDDLYEEARRYAKTRSLDSIENVREVIAEAFPARVHRDWFRSEKVLHLTLALELKDEDDILAPPTFPFLDALRRKFCGHDWAQVHTARRDELHMGITPTLTAILSEQGVVVDESTTYKAWVTSCRDFEVRFKARLTAADRGRRRGNFGNFTNNSSSNNSVAAHKRTATTDPAGPPNKCSTTDPASSTGPFYMLLVSSAVQRGVLVLQIWTSVLVQHCLFLS
ncbi:hypothetical protein EV368DRAFT_87210 [Lentinula lateritia]|nr:hypothetical protein EV368DRAFT_87210 [Lentinula lateritia]